MSSAFHKLLWFMHGSYTLNADDALRYHRAIKAFLDFNWKDLSTEEIGQIQQVLKTLEGEFTGFTKEPLEEVQDATS